MFNKCKTLIETFFFQKKNDKINIFKTKLTLKNEKYNDTSFEAIALIACESGIWFKKQQA